MKIHYYSDTVFDRYPKWITKQNRIYRDLLPIKSLFLREHLILRIKQTDGVITSHYDTKYQGQYVKQPLHKLPNTYIFSINLTTFTIYRSKMITKY